MNRSSGSSPATGLAEHVICLPQIFIRHKQTQMQKREYFAANRVATVCRFATPLTEPTKLTKPMVLYCTSVCALAYR